MDGRSWDADLPPADAADAAGALLGDRLTVLLERWAQASRVDEAARQRARERWLRQAAEEGGTLLGVLADLAERGVPITVRTGGGRRHGGPVRAIGADFVALDTAVGGEVLVALAAISSVRAQLGAVPPTGDRTVRSGLALTDVLAGLAAERERVMVVSLDGGDAVTGTVRALGRDVVTVRVDGAAPATTAYLPLAAIGEVALA
jgi:hypothetical protein